MRFGVYLGPIFPGDMPGPAALTLALDMARAARDSGFDGIFAAQHYLVGPAHMMFQPFPLLARIAAECPGLTLGTSVFLLPLHHPVAVAEATATLDVISGGRLILGVGQGYRDVEFESLDLPKAARGKRLAEGVAAIRKLWAEDGVTFEGQVFRFQNVTIRPKPVQQPGPPIWIGADTVAGVRRAAAIGDAWVASGRQSKAFLREALAAYQGRLAALGRPFTGIPMFREMRVAVDSRRAEAEMKDALEQMYHSYARWGQPGERYDQDFATLRQERIVVGSPQECAEEIIHYRDEFQVPYMYFRAYWPGMDPGRALDAIRLFGQEVIPIVR